MRELTNRTKLENFMKGLGRSADAPGRIYLTGGACAVLLELRRVTIDIDLKMDPDQDALFHAIVELKENLNVNVDLANPGDFIPELSGWKSRSRFIVQESKLEFFHYDFYAQALAKIERSHALDLEDLRQMIERGFVNKSQLFHYFEQIEPKLYRYPAIKPKLFRSKVEKLLKQ